MPKERVILVDGSGLIYRAFFAIPNSFQTAAGLPTNATYGFALMFRKLLAGKRCRLGAVVFDAPGKTFRDERYPAYKAHRPSMPAELRAQLPWIQKVVEVHGWPTLSVPGVEADDVIGTLTRLALEAGHEVHIISHDKDFAQLLGPDVRMIDTTREITYDPELARKKWGVPPAQMVDLLALLGDKVDNIPGVPGVGQKGAAALLERFGSLEAVLANVEALKGRQRATLIEHREQALLSRELATIDQRVPLDRDLASLAIPELDAPAINALYRELEFFSLIAGEDAQVEVGEDAGDYGVCADLEALRSMLRGGSDRPVALIPIFEPPSPLRGDLVGLAFGLGPARARYVPLFGPAGSLGEAGLAVIGPYLADAARPKVVHNLRDLWCLLDRHGLDLRGVVGDAALASFLIDPTQDIPHRLDQIARSTLHKTLAPAKSVIGSGKQQRRFGECPIEQVGPYACHLVAALDGAWPKLVERLEAAEGMEALLRTLSMPMAYVLGKMQRAGIRVDPGELRRLGEGFARRKAEVEARIYELAGHPFNIGSTKQLAVVLFEELGLPVIKRTKTGYSTAAAVLERLAAQHEIARHIVRQRALAKLINTYTAVLQAALDPTTGRIHTTFQQTHGASGRLITTDPDLQRTPIRTEDGKRIRRAFVPAEGWVMISADWSQIELRILAHYSQDPILLASFSEAGGDRADVHRLTASQLFGVAPQAVTRAQRDVGKTVNFATIYGQGATALGQQLGIPRKEAKAYIDRYFARYQGVRQWLDATIAGAHERGYVTTLLGRRRYIPELKSNNWSDRAYGERIAANTPIQGSGADLCKLAMLAIDRGLSQAGLQIRMLVQIHDELLFEAPPEELEAAVALIRQCMESPWPPFSVPLVVEVGTGPSWAAAH